MIRHFPAIAAATLLVGCFPADTDVVPRVQGRVVDAVTHKPIADAKVTVTSARDPDLTVTAITNSGGHFETMPVAGRVWRAIMVDPVVPNAEINIDAVGYESAHLDYYTLEERRTVYLKPR